ncbi:unnamed protein product [Cunninghamella blakesleeana]
MALKLINQSLRLKANIKTSPIIYASNHLYSTNTTVEPSPAKLTEAVTKKFIAQAKKDGPDNFRKYARFGSPSKLVTIEGLPITTTDEDVRKVAREAFENGDKHIREVIFCRNFDFSFRGRCVLMMDSINNAGKLIEYGNLRMVGGNAITMKFSKSNVKDQDLTSFLNSQRRSELISVTDGTSAAGRSVVFSGLPTRIRVDNVLGILRSKNLFPREGTSNTVIPLKTKNQSTVSKFLIKFDNESEAWRCVRAFHNTTYTFNKTKTDYRLSVSVAY